MGGLTVGESFGDLVQGRDIVCKNDLNVKEEMRQIKRFDDDLNAK